MVDQKKRQGATSILFAKITEFQSSRLIGKVNAQSHITHKHTIVIAKEKIPEIPM